ncbi:MAG: 30S ribosomal protein S6 [Candidatus Taylorbacteria bacterium]|nr:30S ribosomal protein S6 [Candidatus Taylorbacteria bacterium]
MNAEINTKDGVRVYEIGYLFLPSIPEEKVGAEAALIEELVEKNKGEIIAREEPKKSVLAYQMIKKIGSTNHRFKEGYFGWVKFEMPQADVNVIKESLDINPSVLRYLLITTIKEDTYLGESAKALAKELAGEGEETTVVEEVKVIPPEVIVNPASVEEIDKSIDEMVTKGE